MAIKSIGTNLICIQVVDAKNIVSIRLALFFFLLISLLSLIRYYGIGWPFSLTPNENRKLLIGWMASPTKVCATTDHCKWSMLVHFFFSTPSSTLLLRLNQSKCHKWFVRLRIFLGCCDLLRNLSQIRFTYTLSTMHIVSHTGKHDSLREPVLRRPHF